MHIFILDLLASTRQPNRREHMNKNVNLKITYQIEDSMDGQNKQTGNLTVCFYVWTATGLKGENIPLTQQLTEISGGGESDMMREREAI